MKRIGLALSGGGFRATLFHLGVVRFLRDTHLLQQVNEIASVSGGSILSAHLVLNWKLYTGSDEEFDRAAACIVKFVQFDVRNHVARRIPLQWPLQLMARLPILDRRDVTPNAVLESYYRKHLFGETCLFELPETPKLNILATNVSTGSLALFNRSGLFIQHRNSDQTDGFSHIPGQMARVSRVVAASSAFPGLFSPVEFTASDLGVHEGEFSTEFFTDGGVYDNLGIRAFSWIKENNPKLDPIIVSDAGKPFQILSNASLGFVGQSVRATDILWDRVWQLEHENFANREGFMFIRMTDGVSQSDDPTAMHPVIQNEVQTIRTDLDRFSNDEIDVLVRHGYEVARKILLSQGLIDNEKAAHKAPWTPIKTQVKSKSKDEKPSFDKPSRVAALSRMIRQSRTRRIFSTFLDFRDWASYVYLAAFLLVFVFAPLQVYQLYKKSQMQSVIIDAVAMGDPDIRQILALATSNPTRDWVGDEVRERREPSGLGLDGVEIFSHSRIYDLRNWHPDESDAARRGKVYIRDRFSLALTDAYQGDGKIAFLVPLNVEDISFRQRSSTLKGVISKITTPATGGVQSRLMYELVYDLSAVPKGEAASIEVEILTDVPKRVRAPFITHTKTDLISVWMLFPPDRPYKNYSLVVYPVDRSRPPQIMNSRFAIDHPYGTFIGWSVINPEPDQVYETRWTAE